MMTKITKILAGTGVLILGIIAFYAWKTEPFGVDSPFITAPAGWYAHSINVGNLVLTKQKDLPDVGATEGFAYGEQIAVSVVKMDKPVEEWIITRVPANDPFYTFKEKGVLNGYQTLKVEHEVGAAGKVLDYYLFDQGTAHIFSLYPLETYAADGKNPVRNASGIQALEQIAKDYSEKI